MRTAFNSVTHSRRERMVDDPKIRGPQDRSRVNIEQDYEVQYWTQEFGVTEEQLRAAVRRMGPSADKLREHLRSARRATILRLAVAARYVRKSHSARG